MSRLLYTTFRLLNRLMTYALLKDSDSFSSVVAKPKGTGLCTTGSAKLRFPSVCKVFCCTAGVAKIFFQPGLLTYKKKNGIFFYAIEYSKIIKIY